MCRARPGFGSHASASLSKPARRRTARASRSAQPSLGMSGSLSAKQSVARVAPAAGRSREARRTGVIHGKAHGMLVQRAQQRVLSVIGVEVVAILVGVDRAHARGDATCAREECSGRRNRRARNAPRARARAHRFCSTRSPTRPRGTRTRFGRSRTSGRSTWGRAGAGAQNSATRGLEGPRG